MWGFWDGSHWKNNAPLYRRDWSIKPAGEAFLELVKKKWQTEATSQTDAKGTASTRGFLGRYDIHVAVGGKEQSASGQLAQGGSTVVVTMKP